LKYLKKLFTKQKGEVNISALVMLFVGALLVYAFIEPLIAQNAVVQADVDADTLTKTFAAILVWALPVGAIAGLIYAGMRTFKGGK